MKMTALSIQLNITSALFLFAGCAPFMYGSNARVKPVAIEAVSSHEEALLQIQSSPTRFFVEVEGNAAAWERARFFLSQYAGPGRVEIQSSADREQFSKVSSSGYRYQISRTFEVGGAQYQVLCTPKQAGADTNAALLNAKNLARFVREGELEVGLIK